MPLPSLNIRQLYDSFDAPVTPFDCGELCAVHNPCGKPFCCDICHAVPAAYHQEWQYVQDRTDLWHAWRGDECQEHPEDPSGLLAGTPDHMLLLACLGPQRCQRQFRLLGCRQFPFFPYITSNFEFIALAYEWEFEKSCWVISHLDEVTTAFRQQFVQTYDALFSLWGEEFSSYVNRSQDLRRAFKKKKRPVPLILRGGEIVLLDPRSQALQPVAPDGLPKFGPYRSSPTEG